MTKSWKLNSKYSYWQLLLLILILTGFISFLLINPQQFSTPNLNASEPIATKYESPDTNAKIIFFVKTESENILEQLSEKKEYSILNSDQGFGILSDRNEATESLKDYLRNGDEDDLALALFYTQKALSGIEMYPIMNCISDIEKISNDFKGMFYYLSVSDESIISDFLLIQNKIEDKLESNSEYEGNINDTLRQIERLNRFHDWAWYDDYDCMEYKEYLEEEYKNQKGFVFLKIFIFLMIFIIGVICGKFYRISSKLDKKATSLSNKLTALFSPKKIKVKTIERIIKTNSILAIFAAIGAIFISHTMPIMQLLGYAAIVDVLILLLAIVCGIYALNNGSEYAKKISYQLFIAGIIAFILLSGYVFFLIITEKIVPELFSTIGDRIQNQTVSN